MQPVVAEVELLPESLAGGQPGQPRTSIVEKRIGIVVIVVGLACPIAVGQPQPVQMCASRPSEPIVDSRGELVEGVSARRGEDTSRSRPQTDAAPLDTLNADRQPVGRRRKIVSECRDRGDERAGFSSCRGRRARGRECWSYAQPQSTAAAASQRTYATRLTSSPPSEPNSNPDLALCNGARPRGTAAIATEAIDVPGHYPSQRASAAGHGMRW